LIKASEVGTQQSHEVGYLLGKVCTKELLVKNWILLQDLYMFRYLISQLVYSLGVKIFDIAEASF